VAVAGSYAYVADYDGGLRVIDVSNPADPQERGHCATPDWAYGVAVAGSYAYVADFAAGLRVIDVSDPANPQERGYYDTPGLAFGVAVVGNHAYVADCGAGLRVIDVSDPASPQERGYHDMPSWAEGVALADSYAYVADHEAGLQVIQFYSGGVEEMPHRPTGASVVNAPTIVRGFLFLAGASSLKPQAASYLLDISSRKVLDLRPGANDVSQLSPGVYFVREETVHGRRSVGNVQKVVVTR
jgi:hypothetical protein